MKRQWSRLVLILLKSVSTLEGNYFLPRRDDLEHWFNHNCKSYSAQLELVEGKEPHWQCFFSLVKKRHKSTRIVNEGPMTEREK